MKELINNLKSVNTYAGADTVNHEGFTAWTPSDKQLLEQLAMTGTLTNSFYASAKELTEDALNLVRRAEAEDLRQAIIRGRNEGFIRSFALLGLVELSKKNPKLFRETFNQIVRTGNDMKDFVDMIHASRGFGRSIKTAIHSWLRDSVNPYYAMKYRKDIADAIRVSRFKGEDPLYAFVLSVYPDVKGITPEKLQAAEEKYPELKARHEFIDAVESGDMTKAADILVKNRIDTDCLTAWADKFDTPIWTQVARLSPVMKFLKYLDKFTREGVDVTKMAQEKVTVDNLKRAKVFPFRLYTALKAVEGRAEGPVVDTLVRTMDDYSRQYDWGIFNQYSWVIAPDISGSMSSNIGNSSLTFAELSAMFVGFFMKGLRKVRVIPWDTRAYDYSLNASNSVMDHMKAMNRMIGGGTYMEAALVRMLREDIYADFSVFLTDTEEYGDGWLLAWTDYHKRYPKARAFLLRADSYQSWPISEEAAKKLGVYQIFGWNDNVVGFMRYILERNNA